MLEFEEEQLQYDYLEEESYSGIVDIVQWCKDNEQQLYNRYNQELLTEAELFCIYIEEILEKKD